MLGMYETSMATRVNFGEGLDSSVVGGQNSKEEYMVGGHSDSASSSELECHSRSTHSGGGVGGGGGMNYSSSAQSQGLSCAIEASRKAHELMPAILARQPARVL